MKRIFLKRCLSLLCIAIAHNQSQGLRPTRRSSPRHQPTCISHRQEAETALASFSGKEFHAGNSELTKSRGGRDQQATPAGMSPRDTHRTHLGTAPSGILRKIRTQEPPRFRCLQEPPLNEYRGQEVISATTPTWALGAGRQLPKTRCLHNHADQQQQATPQPM